MAKKSFDFDNMNPGATVVRSLDPLVIEKPRAPIHIHSYGNETPFFRGLANGKLLATCCKNKQCTPSGKQGYFYLPPRVYCPDCLEKMQWKDITTLATKTAKIHTHITVENPGAFNRVPMPCELISVEIEGVATVLMSQLEGAKPEIGMPIQPKFNKKNPTFTILDLFWIPR
jgi:hypothetical protein